MKLTAIAAWIILVLIAVTNMGCDKSTGPSNEKVSEYFFTTGGQWNYSISVFMTNFHATVPGVIFHDTTVNWSSTMLCSGPHMLRDSANAWKLHAVETTPKGTSETGDYYYRFVNDTLRWVAYSSPSLYLFPKQAAGVGYQIKGRTYTSVDQMYNAFTMGELPPRRAMADSSYYLQPDVHNVLIYPLSVGQVWEYSNIGYGYYDIKEVVGTENVMVGSTAHTAYRIRLRSYEEGIEDNSFLQYDYYSASGLVKRLFTVYGAHVSNQQYPNGFGTIDMIFTVQASSIQ